MRQTVTLMLVVIVTSAVCWAQKMKEDYYEEVDGDRRFSVGGPFNVVDREITLPLQAKWQANLGGGVFTIAREGNRIVATAETGVYAVDPLTGETLWHYARASGKLTPIQFGLGTLYFASYVAGRGKDDAGMSTVHVLDQATGNERWTFEKAGGEFTALSCNGDYLHAVLAMPNTSDPEDGKIVTLNDADGSLVWEKEIAAGNWKFNDAISAQGVLVIAMKRPYEFNLGKAGKLLSFVASMTEEVSWSYGIEAYDAASGNELWTHEVEGRMPIPTQVKRLQVTSDGELFPLLGRGSEKPEGDTFGLPFALNIKTGTPIWEQKTWSRGNEDMKFWANAGYLVEDRYLYGQGIGRQAQTVYLMCADVRSGEMLWRENIKSKKWANVMKSALNAYKTSVSESRARDEARREAGSSGYGSASYTVYKTDPSEARYLGDALSVFTHYGAFIDFPGEKKVCRYVGGKKIWEAEYKLKKHQQIIMPGRILSNYVPVGDTSGRVRFYSVRGGKHEKETDLQLGGTLYQVRVDDDMILFAAENGLHAY